MFKSPRNAFTLIELLIVVAIIAILAAIAVPNFLEAQTRAKVARSRADMRTMVTGLESYRIDQNSYPSDAGNQLVGSGTMKRSYGNTSPVANYTIGYELSTPIAYLTGIGAFTDPFKVGQVFTGTLAGRENYGYSAISYRARICGGGALETALRNNVNRHGEYILLGAGPDKATNNGAGSSIDYRYGTAPGSPTGMPFGRNYDATNGTVSIGDLVRSPAFTNGGWERPDNL